MYYLISTSITSLMSLCFFQKRYRRFACVQNTVLNYWITTYILYKNGVVFIFVVCSLNWLFLKIWTL